MTRWRIPIIAAAISTLACGLADSCYRRQVDEVSDKLEALQREWQSEPQLASQLDRQRDVAGILDVRRHSIELIRRNQPSTFATFSAVLLPPALRQCTVDAALKRFRIVGPLPMQPQAEAWIASVKRAKVTKRGTNATQFMIEGVVP